MYMRVLLFALLGLLVIAFPLRADYAEEQRAQNKARAAYWASKGYNFNPEVMSSFTMDQKVKDIERAQFWKKQGYNFDPDIMSCFTMDQKVKDIERAQFWKKQGYSFDPDIMSCFTMDQKVKDIERAKFWKQRGYNFDPDVMSSFTMDQEAAKSAPSSDTGTAEPAAATVTAIPQSSVTAPPQPSPPDAKSNYVPPPDAIVPVLKPTSKEGTTKVPPATIKNQH
jgi:hypothetical protein